MIHIVIGTKAQLIKMAPIIWELKKKGIAFNLVDLGQHSLITKDLREEFGLDEPGIFLSKGRNISAIGQALLWLAKIYFKSLSASWIKKRIFLNKNGICLIHGDTLSTILGLYLAKRAGLKVAHIEAGLRSFCWLEPFPEEIIRVIAMRFSDLLFASSQWAFDNLIKMGLEKKSILLPGNTGQEATFFSLTKIVDLDLRPDKFCLLIFHRVENIFFKKRLIFIIEMIKKVSSRIPIVFVRHEPTMNQLNRFGLWQDLNKIQNIFYFKILSHSRFIHLLNRCEFVITDGGSIQEEAFYLGKPCLLLRRYTERNEGLGGNVVLSNLDKGTLEYFLSHVLDFVRPNRVSQATAVSEAIVNSLLTDIAF